MKTILLLGSQHGDELLGDFLHEYVCKKHPEILPVVDFTIGNPQARKGNVRFIESDLNRSYNGKSETYEERRAKRLLRYIAADRYALVLDLHTTTCEQPPCLITASTNHPFINYSSIKHVVYMNHEIVHSSLIGACSAAISIEINKQEVNDDVLESLCQDIIRFVNETPLIMARKLFEVEDLLRKSELNPSDAAQLRNFEQTTEGYYPVLVGENSYKKHTEYLGFKTRLRAE